MRILDRLNQSLVVMGIPGLVAISFLDSAAVPLPGGPDAVILLLSYQRPALALLIAAAGAIGSTMGCLVLYSIGDKSGERALSKFSSKKIEWVKRMMDRNGMWAIIVGVVAPPPFPTKLLVLLAGVLKTSKVRFSSAVFAGRCFRYGLVAYLGAHFGDDAADVLKANYPVITMAAVGAILLVYLLRALRSKPVNGGING